ncbi:hypothetical protein [Spirosoma arcticum]
MKIYSISLIALAVALLWVSPNLPGPGNNVNPTGRVGSAATGKTKLVDDSRIRNWLAGVSTSVAPKTTLSGTYNGHGFHTYTNTLTLNSGISFTWYVASVPNRITIKDVNGNTVYSENWAGDANYPGPWGQSIQITASRPNTYYGSLSAGTYTVYVDTVTNVNNGGSADSWYIYY